MNIALDLDKSLTFRKEKRPFFIVHLIEILLYFCIKQNKSCYLLQKIMYICSSF